VALRITLAGNPNSGKTTLFNALTGLNYKVANYPGVTVERKEAPVKLPDGQPATLTDLPGIYSLSGLSIDEKIAAEELILNRPDVVVCVCDVTNLERNLFLATQLIDCEIPVVLALTMNDLAQKRGLQINKEILATALKVPVVAVQASKGRGLQELLSATSRAQASTPFSWVDQEYRELLQGLGTAIVKEKPELGAAPPLILASLALQNSWPIDSEAVRHVRQADYESYEASNRYLFISRLVQRVIPHPPADREGVTERIDRILTHRVWGSLFFLLVMGALFQAIFVFASYPMDLLEGLITGGGEFVSTMLDGELRSLVVDGVIAGVGSVIVFVPQIAILILLLAILEDTGYLSRAALVVDRALSPVGLQGRSFIPLLSSFACAIPGILATRTIPSFGDRIATILIAPLMSCSARLPVYTVLIGAFVPERYLLGFLSLRGLALLGMYLLGIAGAAIVSLILRRTVLRGSPALFVMEMPPYRMPVAKNVLRQLLEAVTSFLKSAGSIILAVTIVLWFLASYPFDKPTIRESYAGRIGVAMEPVIAPLGYNWELGVSILASFAAREVFVSSLSTVYNVQLEDEDPKSLIAHLKEKNKRGEFSPATAASLLVFYVFACMCTSTLAVCRRETNSWGWTAFMFFYMTGIAYFAALGTYQLWIRL
jgi:ferrous iron transport protein B